jgi:hypothetical protein
LTKTASTEYQNSQKEEANKDNRYSKFNIMEEATGTVRKLTKRRSKQKQFLDFIYLIILSSSIVNIDNYTLS